MPGRAVKIEVEMVNDFLDIERCIWDQDYRRKVKRMLNFRGDAQPASANQNMHGLTARKHATGQSAEVPRTT